MIKKLKISLVVLTVLSFALLVGMREVSAATYSANTTIDLSSEVPGCQGRTSGYSVTTGASCASNAPSAQPAEIPGCGNRMTGYSVLTGQSCAWNVPAAPVAPIVLPVPEVPPPVTPDFHDSYSALSYDFGATVLRGGSRGSAVTQLQIFLNYFLGLNLATDGIMGPKTISAVKEWQKTNGLVPDGIVGPRTKAKIKAMAYVDS